MTNVRLEQAALCDGGVRLEPDAYDVEIKSRGDGTVVATFIGAINSVVVEGGKQPNAPSFASLGFTPNSAKTFQKQGNRLNIIVNGQGSNQILIGLLLPAVQKAREAAAPPVR